MTPRGILGKEKENVKYRINELVTNIRNKKLEAYMQEKINLRWVEVT
jgi:hypothetical protein